MTNPLSFILTNLPFAACEKGVTVGPGCREWLSLTGDGEETYGRFLAHLAVLAQIVPGQGHLVLDDFTRVPAATATTTPTTGSSVVVAAAACCC